jgi:hypothetical protein
LKIGRSTVGPTCITDVTVEVVRHNVNRGGSDALFLPLGQTTWTVYTTQTFLTTAVAVAHVHGRIADRVASLSQRRIIERNGEQIREAVRRDQQTPG